MPGIIDDAIIGNANKFREASKKQGLMEISDDEIWPLPYGNIALDYITPKGLVSVEIGLHTVGFFTDFKDGKNYGSEGIKTDFNIVPEEIAIHLRRE